MPEPTKPGPEPACEDVYCKCGQLIGRSVPENDTTWLILAGSVFPLASADLRCICGRMFYWKQSLAAYTRLMNKYSP